MLSVLTHQQTIPVPVKEDTRVMELRAARERELDTLYHMGLGARKPVFGGLRTTQAQTSLCIRAVISTFVIRYLESIICKLATGEI